MTVEQIEEAIRKLAPEELAKFRRWFAAFESGTAAPNTGQDRAAKLGRLAGRAIAEFRRRSREP